MLGKNLMLGKRWSAQVPGIPGLGAILSVLTFCRPVFFHPSPGCSIFIHSGIQPMFIDMDSSLCLPPVFPADWPSGGPDVKINLEGRLVRVIPLGLDPFNTSAI